MIHPTPLGTVEDVAAYIGVPKQTLYNWRTQAKGPRGIRVGKHLRYRWEDVDAWLDEQADGPSAGAA
ncbi:helix-turn-helix domain-containing protein [Geodermatophilus sp. YIM 151500]|uniref:helix-turn-helix transcriptional regulator n=1 Tax=Geodermatophilus sp. YIM 151500 TaxID=2984531 RepID=UPI0021E37C96|nr:helix-turn-helix domain-containing protein [Geodermatophilus sp. YIM 151500]MCV2489454.1 helix-turn-helix domain-containing protein [Geodermatophilus sp. YIM 151500]